MTVQLRPEPLTAAAFAPFGDVIAPGQGELMRINEGTTERFHDLAQVDVATEGGRTLINIFRGQPRPQPIAIRMLERHPLGSQAFVPLAKQAYFVVVAPPAFEAADIRCFLVEDGAGVNYARGTWHHPLLVCDPDSDFLVIDRGGPGDNLEEFWFPATWPDIRLEASGV